MLKDLISPDVDYDAKWQIMEKVYKKLNYKVFRKGIYNLNIFGIRTNDPEVNVFNDYMGVFFYKNVLGVPRKLFFIWKATTDPGLFYLNHPLLVKGTAILKEGQYLSTFALDMHRGKYLALCQRLGPVTVYRDRDKDNVLNFINPETGYFGINLHRASKYRLLHYVGKYSAGCQVTQNYDEYGEFINICKNAAHYWGNSFSYTLLTENQINAGGK